MKTAEIMIHTDDLLVVGLTHEIVQIDLQAYPQLRHAKTDDLNNVHADQHTLCWTALGVEVSLSTLQPFHFYL